MSRPQSIIKVCSGVRLNNQYDHTIYFESKEAQLSYFTGKVVKTFSDYTYLRKNWAIKVNATMGVAKRWSYLFFTNPDDAQTYFYFITDVQYINDATVELSLEMDVMQTYAFDYTMQPCFVEREHSVNDEIGENTNDEGLDTGDLINQFNGMKTNALETLCILIMSTIDLPEYASNRTEVRATGSIIDRVFCGAGIYAVSSGRAAFLKSLLTMMEDDGKTDAIISMWMYPRALVQLADGESDWDATGGDVCGVKRIAKISDDLHVTVPIPDTLDGYTPKNRKMLQYPYRCIYVTNNSGNAAAYRYEWFESVGDPSFMIEGALGADGAVRIAPEYYADGSQRGSADYSLTLSGFPTCGMNSDAYKLWLAQNQNAQNVAKGEAALKIVGGLVATVAGVAASATGVGSTIGVGGVGAGLSMMASGASQVAQLNAQARDYDIQPPSARGATSANINVATYNQLFTIYRKCVDRCHAERIDDFFTMYGYKTARVKRPNVNSRPHFNYVKTVGSNVRANLCAADVGKINAIFDRGITFWKNGDEIGDYSVDNRVTT